MANAVSTASVSYTHLTSYDPEAGTLSINPDHIVKWRYYGTRTSVGSYWLGMEDSAAIYDGYLFIADNGGNLMCLNLNTLQLVWVQDVLDDSNSTPVLSVEDGHLYLYAVSYTHLTSVSSARSMVSTSEKPKRPQILPPTVAQLRNLSLIHIYTR